MTSHVHEHQAPKKWWERAENGLAVAILAIMVVVPVVAVVIRWTTGLALAGANVWVQALNLWMAFVGGTLAARASQHLALSTGTILQLKGWKKDLIAGFTSSVATAVTAFLAYGSVNLILAERHSTLTLTGGVPMWVIQIAMPVGFLVMAIRFAIKENRTWHGRVVALLTVALACLLALVPAGERSLVVWGAAGVLLTAVALGAPLFTAMGGMAMLLFYGAPIPIALAAVPAETFRIVSDPTLVSLPLFTLAGYLLAEGGASKRLVKLFQVWFGWLPGGVAAAAVLVSAFFTTFTGASGVTILALGGLLLPALKAAGYREKFAVGLIVASGSIGLLFPPSLPVILYGVASHVPITDLFIGGIVPGILLVSLLVGVSAVVGIREHGIRYWFPVRDEEEEVVPTGQRVRAKLVEMGAALWGAKFEALLPVVVLVGIFGGFMTIFEAAAFTAAYAFLAEVVIHRDLHVVRDVPRVFVETATLMGGVLIILGVALGFTSYLVDAEVPLMVRDWVAAHIGNKILFILMLNLLLLAVGCLMDIYSAIVVVVPLIIPVAATFGIHPVHLGILFLANLELGYLTPPVGLNLFLASFRFKLPLTRVYRYALPFLGIMAIGVLIIAYVPYATTWAFDEDSAQPAPNFFEDELMEGAPQPEQLSPEDLERMMQELDEGEAPPAPPPSLDMDAIFQELEEEGEGAE
ncbi:MAG: TRAP transporter large permease subunit [Deltaproteobacteria bacterium]|nr:TRAP transporter large permease subunit [Deltaproteobacteria bacterium]MBW2256049.1 TRAP transporter large permease subunit [Deltaproteobacteria bacterium]